MTHGPTNEIQLISNTAWLAGHAAFVCGEGCPWGDESARLGWIAAKNEAAISEPNTGRL